MSAISKSTTSLFFISILIFAFINNSAQLRLDTDSLANSLPQLLNSTDVDQVMLGIELQKVDQRIKEYLNANIEVDQNDEKEITSIQDKLATGIKNAQQGEMGCPFAQSKINDIKRSLAALKDDAIEETDEGMKIWRDVQTQDKKALENHDVKLNVFDALESKVQKEIALFPQIMQLEKLIDLIKNDEPDEDIKQYQVTFNEQIQKIHDAQGIQKPQKPKSLVQQISKLESQEDKMDHSDLISEEDDKLYKNPNDGLSVSELKAQSNGENTSDENQDEQKTNEEQSKDSDQDPKPDNNVNLQTSEMSSSEKEKKKATQWSSDGDFLAYTNYQMNSNQSIFEKDQQTTFQETNLIESDQEPKVVQVE